MFRHDAFEKVNPFHAQNMESQTIVLQAKVGIDLDDIKAHDDFCPVGKSIPDAFQISSNSRVLSNALFSAV